MSSLSLGNTTDVMKKQFYKGTYPEDHWALQPFKLEDPKVIAFAYANGSFFAIYKNPTDKRGYRVIVRLIDNKDMQSTINRDYSQSEQRGLSLVSEMVERVFGQIVPIVQTLKAGNNSHKFDPNTRITTIGNAGEPSFLHIHIWGRGDPEAEYIPGIKLDGPAPSLNFNPMGKTITGIRKVIKDDKEVEEIIYEPGNAGKVSWKESEMEKAVKCWKSLIEPLKEEYEKMGLYVITK